MVEKEHNMAHPNKRKKIQSVIIVHSEKSYLCAVTYKNEDDVTCVHYRSLKTVPQKVKTFMETAPNKHCSILRNGAKSESYSK